MTYNQETMTMTKRRLLTINEAAELLRTSKGTLQRWLAENRNGIRQISYKPGGETSRLLFFEDELIEWVRQNPSEKEDETPDQ